MILTYNGLQGFLFSKLILDPFWFGLESLFYKVQNSGETRITSRLWALVFVFQGIPFVQLWF